MVATPIPTVAELSKVTISWEALPEDFILEEEPVENTAQPLFEVAFITCTASSIWSEVSNRVGSGIDVESSSFG